VKYVCDLQRAIIILSNDEQYVLDNTIINNLNSKLNNEARKEKFDKVAYIEIEKADSGNISGNYCDWVEDDPTGQPSIKMHFNYDYKLDKLSTSNL
jgi:hypothetical protein